MNVNGKLKIQLLPIDVIDQCVDSFDVYRFDVCVGVFRGSNETIPNFVFSTKCFRVCEFLITVEQPDFKVETFRG